MTNHDSATDLAFSRDATLPHSARIAILNSDGSVDSTSDLILPEFYPRPKSLESGATAIAYVGFSLVVAKNDGALVVDGETISVNFATPGSPHGFKSLAGSSESGRLDTVLGLRSDGTVAGWNVRTKSIVEVPGEVRSDVLAIAAGGFHFLALKADGSVVAWGDVTGWDSGQTLIPLAARTGVKAIAAGEFFSMALKSDGKVIFWGEVPGPESVPPGLQGITLGITAGSQQALALVESIPPVLNSGLPSRSVPIGQSLELNASATGPNLSYQWFRDGQRITDATARTFPLLFAPSGDYSVVITNVFGSVTSSAPAVVTVALPVPGSVVARGAGEPNRDGQDDWGQSTVPAEASTGIVAVAGGEQHSLALRHDGVVIAWGDGLYDETAVPSEAQSGIEAISAGYFHSLALTRSGKVIQWGSRDFGQGDVPASAQQGVIAISTRAQHSLALKMDGSVIAWGENFNGQSTVPPEAKSGVIAIAAGGSHSLALKTDGSVVAWGDKTMGGRVPPITASNVIAIAAGRYHSLALRRDGSVVAWGGDDAPPSVGSGVIAIAAGMDHSVALRADGTVVAWGSNADGQLEIPPAVQGYVTAIAAGGNHTLLVLASVALACELSTAGPVVSWPTNTVGMRLQSSPSLAPGSTWQDVAETPTILGRRYMLAVPTHVSSHYFRLSR